MLVLRGAMSPADAGASTRRCAPAGSTAEDAWQRAVEFLFERLAVRWEIAGAEPIERQKELLARFRFAGRDERRVDPRRAARAPRRELPRRGGAVNIIDLSVPTGPGPAEPLPPTIDYDDHAKTAPLIAQIFGCEVSDLPDGQGWASETVTLITHAGTHVDAPWHYFPTSGGERARTIDELPLDWFLRPGVRLDVREVPWGERIEISHLEAALGEYELQPYDIVLLWTGAEEKWDTGDYFNAGSGLARESTTWLLERGVKVIGTDAWGLDRPFGPARGLRARPRRLDPVGGPPRRHRPRVLPDREAPQPRRLPAPPASSSPACP